MLEDKKSMVMDAICYPSFPDFDYLLQPGKGYANIEPDEQPISR